MTPIAQALTTALLHFIWQGIAGALLLGLVLVFLRRSSANSRYLASCIALAVLAVAPIVTVVTVYPVSSATEQASTSVSAGSVSVLVGSLPRNTISRASVETIDGWILPLWSAGVFVFALRLAWASGHASSLRRRGVEADSSLQTMIAGLADRLGVRRKLQVLVSSVTDVPSVVGWVRPVILLPAAVAVGLTPQQLEALLAHELAHIRRHDYFVNILQMVVETVLFYHPAVWWVSSRIRHERELCCDDIAVGSCGNAIAYARALAQLERLRPAAPTLAMGSAGGPLYLRIQRLLGPNSEYGPSRLACAVGLLAGVICLGFILDTARAQQPEVLPLPVPAAPAPLEPLPPLLPVQQRPPSLAPPIPVPAPLTPAEPIEPVAPVAAATSPALIAPPPISVAPVQLPIPLAVPTPALALPVLAAPVPIAPFQAPSTSPRWVLFRGNDVVVRGSVADEERARITRASFTGDLLWFVLEGNAFVTQDREVLDQLQKMSSALDAQAWRLGVAERIADVERVRQGTAQLEQIRASRNALQAMAADLENRSRNLNAPSSPQGLADFSAQVARLQAEVSRMQAMLAQNDAEVSRMQARLNAELLRQNAEADVVTQSRGVADILRDAVQTGKAKPTPLNP